MKYTAHREWLLNQPQNQFTKDLLALVDQAQSQPSFNAVEYNNDKIHRQISGTIRMLTLEADCSFSFNKSLHGVAGFGMENGVAVIITYDLKKVPVEQFDAPDWGLNAILTELNNHNFHQLVA